MNLLNRKKAAFAVFLIAVFLLGGCGGGSEQTDVPGEKSEAQTWTCSMHPQIKLPSPGQCPICAMDLIPIDVGGGEDEGERTLTVSPAAAALADIQTSPVERKFVRAEIEMAGKIDYDETSVTHITAWVAGRLDRLYVDYTGIEIKKGDHMVYMYSPEVLTAQQELIQALKTVKKLEKSNVSSVRDSALGTVKSARKKLLLWGLTDEQVSEIEGFDKTSDHIEIKAPVGGTVIEKHVSEGMYVKTGTRIYTIADLSRVWVKLDVYESDLQWVRYGQEVEFRTEAYPGEIFHGTITFVDPVLNPKTRTIKVRVIVENTARKLKPGMFVHAVVRPEIAAGGKVMDPRMSGKWISPMHPEIVKDEPGSCDVCGMDLVPAEELGYVAAEKSNAPLVIPASAPLLTGKRAVVYVKVPGTERPTFEGREILLGPRAGDYYIVRSGLEEGELVVTRGSFKIDSALQIQAKPSMMSPPTGGSGMSGHEMHGAMGKSQALCPIMGGKINREQYTDYNGKRVYFCCPGCEPEFKKNADKYMKKFEEAGIELEDTPND